MKASRIFPVPTYMIKDLTIYKVYKVMLEHADYYGRITLSNEEIAKIIKISPTSSTITTSVNKLKEMGVVKRIVREKNSREKTGMTRTLQLCQPYDRIAQLFKQGGPIQAEEFLSKIITI